MLEIYPPGVKSVVVVGVCCVLAACSKDTPRPPIVTNQTEPWEERLAQERRDRELEMRLQQPRTTAGPRRTEVGGVEEDSHSGIVTVLADIVAFPLRGAAWLAHTLLTSNS